MLDYVSKVVSTEHAKFRLFDPLRNQLKEDFKKRKRKKGYKYSKVANIEEKKTFFVCESTLNMFIYDYILDLC